MGPSTCAQQRVRLLSPFSAFGMLVEIFCEILMRSLLAALRMTLQSKEFDMQYFAILLYLQSFATSVSICSRRWHCQPFRTGKRTQHWSFGKQRRKKWESGFWSRSRVFGFSSGFLRIPFLYVHFLLGEPMLSSYLAR